MRAKILAALGFVLGIFLAALKFISIGKKAEKAENLEAHMEAGKAQRKAEKQSDNELKEQVDEIKSTSARRGRFTQ
jgi:sortase (surface protein transpeptidase)